MMEQEKAMDVIESQEQEAHQSNYLRVFIGLFVLTITEVIISYLPFPNKTPQTIILVVGSFFKAALVVLFYMHLKYDSRWYAVILGVPVVFATLLSVTLVL